MDLSKLKWVFIAAVVIGGGWLVTEGGINWVYNNATESVPGEDPEGDEIDEATLSKYGGFLLATFRYEKAEKFYQTAIDRYPDGANRWWNYYQMARCLEKLSEYQRTADILYLLYTEDADQYDERVPDRATLKNRIDKLIEVHDLQRYDRF